MSDEKTTKKDEATAATAEAPVEDENAKAPAAVDEDDLGKMQQDLERFRDLALRSQADFDNYRKRAAREKEDAIKYANTAFLDRLIPILDNFELGLAAAKGAPEKSPIVAGMEMVAKQLTDFLSDSGVTTIDATGQKFDPNIHEAIDQEESDEVAENHVIRQMRKGFKLKDRLLRPANVIVSKGKPAAKK